MTKRHLSSSSRSARAIAWAITTFVAGGAAACYDTTASDNPGTTAHAAIGECVRNEPVLRNTDPVSCATDVNCPCGSFCDPVENECTFNCMIPPANQAESCAVGTQCDDSGRCVAPNAAPAGLAPFIAVNPPVLNVRPAGGAPQQFTTQLSVYTTTDPAAVAAAQSTVVRVVASDDLEVSCNAASFGHACDLTGWTFAWNGSRQVATRPFWARTVASNTDSHGHVTLAVDATDTKLVVPAAAAALALLDGSYVGVATSAVVTSGVPVDVRVRGNFLIVRDPSQIIAPDGALVLDLVTSTAVVPTARRMVWLRAPTGPVTATVVGEYTASGPITFAPATGALAASFTIALPGPQSAPATDTWALQLQRTADHMAECSTDSDCGAGSECPSSLQVCVPSSVWSPPTTSVGNQFEDARALTWWNASLGFLGSSDATPAGSAFATTGAELIETLMCTVANTEADAGRFGIRQIVYSGPSRSGDLACVNGNGATNQVSSAVGLVTHIDRQGTAASLALLGTCLQDLARTPWGFGSDFAVHTGQCANLGRFVPALRLLATGELGKRTKVNERRTRGLFVRLVQQWSQLHGFVASTGLSAREYDDAVAASPADARRDLVKLLDVIDAGWAALLDKNIAATVASSATWGPTDTDAINDYREAKKPVVYWPFNSGSQANRDLVRGLDLVQRINNSGPQCQISDSRDSIAHGFNCPGFRVTLPPDAPSIGGNTNLTVSMYLRTPNTEFPAYFGGTIFQTETLAAVSAPLERNLGLSVVHPTTDGGAEWVSFSWDNSHAGAQIAIVRDTQAMTYTLYAYSPSAGLRGFTERYYHEVGGVLPGTVARRIALANGRASSSQDGRNTIGQFPHGSSFAGIIDDFAIFDSALSQREFLRFASARGESESGRHAYPETMTLTAYGTQDINVPVGASLLETQVAHLEVVARLAQQLTRDSQAACEGPDPAAQTSLDFGILRAGQAVRQSFLIENLAKADTSVRANQARQLLRAKRGLIARSLSNLRNCTNPYGMTEGEVPLYFGDVNGETAAFFAPADHLLGLAQARADAAASSLTIFQDLWLGQRQGQIQQLTDDTVRGIRVEEMQTRFGEQLKRLCGIGAVSSQEILLQIQNNTFSVDTCFVKPTTTCLGKHTGGRIMDADPSCYRGVLGAQLMEMRAAYHGQQAAYQAWQAAVGNADGIERQCVLQEMDAFGCSALDRHDLTGVTCPAGHQGTLQLVTEFNRYQTDKAAEKGWLQAVVTVVATAAAVVAATVATGPGAAFLVAAASSLGLLSDDMDRSIESRKRNHAAVLQARAAQADIRACWTGADQYHRAIASAEETSKEAADRMQSAIIAFENALAEARDAMIEGPIVINRELTRPSIPITFHNWLPEGISNYRFLLDSSRRYTYIALRAIEFVTQESYATPQLGKPSRTEVLGAWRPYTLGQQLLLMRTATSSLLAGGGRPSEDHLVLDVAKDIFGLENSDELGVHLDANARPVYSTEGTYMGRGLRFTFLPARANEQPIWRCAERLWRSNVAADTGWQGAINVKLLKRTVFASRSCTGDGLQVATLRPETNLLAASGDPQAYVEQPAHTVASINAARLDVLGALDAFLREDDFTNGSSSELAGQGLFGDYVLLFPVQSPSPGPTMAAIKGLYIRFDFLSIDNTPGITRLRKSDIKLDKGGAAIIVD